MTGATAFEIPVHHLRFQVEAATTVHLGAQAGAQLRGAFWNVLQEFACNAAATRQDSTHTAYCPMCRLMARETMQHPRGLNPPRPFAIQPPLGIYAEQDRLYNFGERFHFGVSLFGETSDLFPYLCQAVYRMGAVGVGYGRGQFVLKAVQAVNPISRTTVDLMNGHTILPRSPVPITAAQIVTETQRLNPHSLRLRFLTPTQIIENGSNPLRRPRFVTLIARLLERCQALEEHYTADGERHLVWRERHLQLTQMAADVQPTQDNTRWVNVRSGSRRSGKMTDIGGFVGEVRFEGYLRPFLPWLLWGQSLHIGKNAVKGNGWYEIAAD